MANKSRMSKKTRDAVKAGLKQAKAGEFAEPPGSTVAQKKLPPELKRAYRRWLISLPEKLRDYVNSRLVDTNYAAFIAGWSACCEVAYNQPLLGHPKVITGEQTPPRVGKPEKPAEMCGRCLRSFKPYSTPFVNTFDLLSESWICWRCAGVENQSKLPSYDPDHVCGVFCDGQDGRSSECAKAKRRCVACRQPAGVHGRDDQPCQTFVERIEPKSLLVKKDRLSWYCDNRDRAGVERGPILLNGEIWGYQEKNEAISCAKRNGKRLKILPARLRKRKKAKKRKA